MQLQTSEFFGHTFLMPKIPLWWGMMVQKHWIIDAIREGCLCFLKVYIS